MKLQGCQRKRGLGGILFRVAGTPQRGAGADIRVLVEGSQSQALRCASAHRLTGWGLQRAGSAEYGARSEVLHADDMRI